MLIEDINLDGSKNLIPIGLTPVMIIIRDSKGKSIYDLNNEKIINGKKLLECHYFIKKTGNIIAVRSEDMQTELDKEIFNKYMIVIDIEGDFNVDEMDQVRGNSLIKLIKNIRTRYPQITKVVPYYDIYPESETPGSNFPISYINELIINNDDLYYVKVNKKSPSTNPYLINEHVIYKTRKLFLSSPYLCGNDVSTLKYKLSELGFDVDLTNNFYDENTYEVINKLRQKLGLPQNGIATIDLMEEIDSMVNAKNVANSTSNSVQYTRMITLTVPFMKGNDVEQVQSILYANDYFNGKVDGIFRDNSVEALKRFQNDNELEPNGIVTPVVWEKLSKFSNAKYERLIYLTKPNMVGDDILKIQKRLLFLGYNEVELNSIYDAKTESIVKQFQRNNNLNPNGKITLSVFKKLFK